MALQLTPFKSQRSLLLCNVYRAPDTPDTPVNTDKMFEEMFDAAHAENKETIIMGDFNINLLDKKGKSHPLFRAIFTLQMEQLVNEVTRPVSGSRLDHIYTSHSQNINSLNVLNISKSDYLPVLFTRLYDRFKTHPGTQVTIRYRNFKDFDEKAFLTDLKTVPWFNIDLWEDSNLALDSWSILFFEVVDQHAPWVEKRIRKPRNHLGFQKISVRQ